MIIKENTDIPSEILEFSEKIDFDGLNKILSDRLGIDVKLVPEKVKNNREYRIEAKMSKNLASECGIMSSVFSEVELDLFNSSISRDKDTGVLFFWCTPHFSYELVDGGYNGIKICSAVFTEKDGWKIR